MQEYFHVFLDSFCVCFATNNPDDKIIRISRILHPFIITVVIDVRCCRFFNHFQFLKIFASDFLFFIRQTIPYLSALFPISVCLTDTGLICSRKMFLLGFCIEVFCIIFHKFVQFMKVNICQHWTDSRPLRHSAIGSVECPLFHISCF